jgi:hypothetical protein
MRELRRRGDRQHRRPHRRRPRTDGQDVVRISRSLGVDLSTGDGLDHALTGVNAVIDVTIGPTTGHAQTVAYFGTATRNLLVAGERDGVRHHVLLSIVGIDRATWWCGC